MKQEVIIFVSPEIVRFFVEACKTEALREKCRQNGICFSDIQELLDELEGAADYLGETVSCTADRQTG